MLKQVVLTHVLVYDALLSIVLQWDYEVHQLFLEVAFLEDLL